MTESLNDSPKVEMVAEGKAKKSFLENFSYIRRDPAQGKKLKVVGLTMALFALGASFFRGEPEKEVDLDSNVSIPSIGQEQVDPTKGNYSRAEEAKNFDGKRRAGASGPPVKLSGPKLISRPKNIKIPPGTIVRAELVTGASNGLTKATLKDDVKVNGEVLIEAGSTILGRGASTEDRLFVSFTKVIHKDSDVSQIEAEAADVSDKTLGLKGSKLASRSIKMAANVGLKFLAGASEALQETEGQQGATVRKPTMKNAVLNGTAQAALEESNDIASSYKNAQPVIQVPAGSEIYILFSDGGG